MFTSIKTYFYGQKRHKHHCNYVTDNTDQNNRSCNPMKYFRLSKIVFFSLWNCTVIICNSDWWFKKLFSCTVYTSIYILECPYIGVFWILYFPFLKTSQKTKKKKKMPIRSLRCTTSVTYASRQEWIQNKYMKLLKWICKVMII